MNPAVEFQYSFIKQKDMIKQGEMITSLMSSGHANPVCFCVIVLHYATWHPYSRGVFVLSVKLTNIHLDESDSGVPFYCQIKHNVVIDPGVVAATFAPGKQTMSIYFAHEFINVQVLSGRAQKNGVRSLIFDSLEKG